MEYRFNSCTQTNRVLEEIRECIKDCGYTQEHVAKAMGCSRVNLNNKLNGLKEFKFNEFIRLMMLLGLKDLHLQ